MWSGADASYLAAITAAGRKYTWHGTLTDANGSTYNFDAEDIVKGSGQISKMVSSDTSLDIGTVYTSELTIRLYLAVNRYVLFGGTIDLYCDMDVNGATYSVPMGEYIIASCTQEMACISITAYDAMTKLDSVNVVQDLGASTPYAWITYFLSRAGLTLGTAQATIEAMPNGTELLTFTNCNTELAAMPCRDALAYMCMILCANAYVGRDGKVYIQQYSMTADDDIAANERFSSSFSDFTTNYTSVTLGIHATGTTEYYAQPTDDGLNYDLGANPWMQAGSAAARETMCRAILADLNAVSYEPYTVSIPIRPELDPMDVLTFSGNQASTDKGAVTSVVYKLGGAMTIKCSGENPRLAGAKSKTQKSLEALSSTVAKEINQMSVVQNSSSVTCGENTETSILTYNFEVTQEENTTMVDVSVVIDSHARESLVNDVYTLSDVVANLSFYVDDSEVGVYSPRFIVDEGNDTITFNYSLSGLSVGAHEFDVRLTMNGAYGIVGAGNAHELLWGYGITFEVYVKSIEVTTLPTTTTFYAGQRLNYNGIVVSGVYNNGLRTDVTSESSFYPAQGTALTESDAGTLTVDVDYDSFSTDFDLNVELLGFDCNISEDTLPTFDYANETTFFKSGTDLYVTNSYIKSNSSNNYAKIVYALLAVGNDGSVTVQNSGAVQKDFAIGQLNTRTINGIARIGTRFYIPGSSSYEIDGTFFEMKYVDVSDGSSGNMNVSYVYLADESANLYSFRLASGAYFVVDGYIIFPYVRCTLDNGGTYTQHESMAWAEISGNSVTIRILDPSLWTYDYYYTEVYRGTSNWLFDQPCYVKYADGVISVYEMTCDQGGLHCYHKNTFSTGFTSTPARKRVKNSNKYVFYTFAATSPYIVLMVGVYDYDTDTYSGEWTVSEEDSMDIVQMIMGTSDQFERVAWSEEKELYLYPISSYYASYEKQIVYASGDFETWIKTTCDSTRYEGSMPASFSYSDGIIVGGFTAQTQTYTYTPATLTYKVD